MKSLSEIPQLLQGFFRSFLNNKSLSLQRPLSIFTFTWRSKRPWCITQSPTHLQLYKDKSRAGVWGRKAVNVMQSIKRLPLGVNFGSGFFKAFADWEVFCRSFCEKILMLKWFTNFSVFHYFIWNQHAISLSRNNFSISFGISRLLYGFMRRNH